MAFRFSRDCVVVYHGKPDPTEAQWDGYLAELAARPGISKFFVNTEGGGPTGKQRAALNRVCEGRSPVLAVMTASAAVRGMLTALRWMGWSHAAPFSLDDLAGAVAHLGLSESQAKAAKDAIEEMRDGFETPRSASG